jgi:hypothetical protein
VTGISSAYAAAIAAAYLTQALLQPTPTNPFKQPGSEKMQAVKKLASIFEEMAPPRVVAKEHHTSIPPRVASPQTPQAQATMVANTTNHPEVTRATPYKLRRSPRAHMPPQVTQEERVYQLIATALPKIKSAHSITYVVTGQKLEYRQLLQQPDLKPIWEQAFTNKLGRSAQ